MKAQLGRRSTETAPNEKQGGFQMKRNTNWLPSVRCLREAARMARHKLTTYRCTPTTPGFAVMVVPSEKVTCTGFFPKAKAR